MAEEKEKRKMAEEKQKGKMAEEKPKQVVKMAERSAPYRMKMSHQNQFFPKSIFFLTSSTIDDIENRVVCFNMKAAAVYSAIFDQHTNEKTLDAAGTLLKSIARQCYFLITGDEIGPLEETHIEDLPQSIILIIDAVYLVVGFLHDINECAGIPKSSIDRENLDKYFMSKHGALVLSDLAMIDNQLLLDLIIKVVETLPKALAKVPSQLKGSSLGKFNLSFNKDNIPEVVTLFSWYYSPFYASTKQFQLPKTFLLQGNYMTLLDCLHHCIVQSAGTNNGKSPPTSRIWPVPTAKELWRAGVHFEASIDRLFVVEFKAPTLTLPVLFWDSKLETVVMNLVALESSRPRGPVTRYFQLLSELVDDEEDVRLLKRSGVMTGKWKRDHDVVGFVERVNGFASYLARYPEMDLVMEQVKKYIDDRKNRFLVRYGPGNSWVPYIVATATVILIAIVFFYLVDT
ncbi:hypothetical protein AAC387_Pa01g2709 [Persea americana]